MLGVLCIASFRQFVLLSLVPVLCMSWLCCCVCRWEPMLGVLAVGLYPQLRNEQVAYLCHLVRVLHNTQDYLALVALLLQVRVKHAQGLLTAAQMAVHHGFQLICCCPCLSQQQHCNIYAFVCV